MPGWVMIRTPTKPMTIAAQRLGPAHSLSSGPASAVTTKGAANMIENRFGKLQFPQRQKN